MEAMEHLNPAQGDGAFTPYEDYPRRRWPEYKSRHEDDPDPVVSVRFELDEGERSRLEESGGHASDGEVVVTKDYANDLHWEFELDEAAYVDQLVAQHSIDSGTDTGEKVLDASSISELQAAIDGAGDDASESKIDALAEAVPPSKSAAVDDLGNEILRPELPTFHYVGEYTTLDAEIDLGALRERREAGEATPSDVVFESLLSVANLDVDSLRDADDWRGTVTELESASNEITNSVTQYWSQADDVEVHLRGHEDGDSRSIELRVENPHTVSPSSSTGDPAGSNGSFRRSVPYTTSERRATKSSYCSTSPASTSIRKPSVSSSRSSTERSRPRTRSCTARIRRS